MVGTFVPREHLSQILMDLWRKQLSGDRYVSVVTMMLVLFEWGDRWVSYSGKRDLQPFPVNDDPPWEHREVLLRSWWELVGEVRRRGLRDL